jgi:hypothetical protein
LIFYFGGSSSGENLKEKYSETTRQLMFGCSRERSGKLDCEPVIYDFRAGEPEFSYLLNIFLLEGELAQKIIKRKILGDIIASLKAHLD